MLNTSEASLPMEVKIARAASTHCTQCRNNAAGLALCTFNVLQARAAGPQCTQCSTVFIVDQLAGAAAGKHCTV